MYRFRKFYKVCFVGLILFLMSWQIANAGNWYLWNESKNVKFYLRFVPQNNRYAPHYAMVVYNASNTKKIVHFMPVLHINGKITSYLSSYDGVTIAILPGKKSYLMRFYIDKDRHYIKTHLAPSFGFESYYIK